MILRRLTENLRAQNWTAIGIEFLIVVIGVFIGTQVSNWNQVRLEKRETERMLVNLVPELQSQLNFFDDVRAYYRVTRRFADQALAGWKGDSRVSDEQFVIAAYQASQITGIGTNAENWALTFGGDQLRNIEDKEVRRNLEVILTSDYGPIGLGGAASPYREQVRRVIPIGLQDDIRRECGDRFGTGHVGFVRIRLPETCKLRIPPAEAAEIAAALRARPELARELNWHLAGVAVVLTNVDILEAPVRDLDRQLTRTSAKENAG
ncbi:MAG TPA: hypothetical protein VFK86_13435 [Bauldia sp.]|jgi:hypothetical protein|nr:hypothetical protein [Bauldia sp.]